MKTTSKIKRRNFLTIGGFAVCLPFMNPMVGFSKQTNSIKEGRRVVTGLNSSGKSIILSDGFVPENARYLSTKNSTSDLWIENQVPVDLNDITDHFIGYSMKTEPPQGGVTARIVTWQPGFSYPMHSTNTLDILFIVSGTLELILDESKTILAAGDSAIQRGTNHGWRVDGDEPCTVAVVLISAVKN
jgi:quercetin dioxygenase-like cupin family protein